ncbi:MAG TPA: DNA-3-methyladenine glycosylase [Chloroflexota bacterium]|nr:DNA-3-methyladenine glycosylase [Chloroflexota bacterium]
MVASLPSSTLTPRAPFDARPILRYYGRSPLEPLDIVVDGGWRRAVRLGEQKVLFEAAAGGTADEPSVSVRLLAVEPPPPTPPPCAGEGSKPLALAADAVSRWWRLDQDPADLGEIADRDPILGALLARLHGARSPLMPSPFECLVWAILGQQITVAFAYKMKRALVERYGESITHEGRPYWLFPEAARLAEADPLELRELQFSRQKSDYVRSLAALVAEDRIDWGELAEMPSEAAIKVLTRLRGVGRWTAEYVLMRGLGHQDVIPAADVGLQSAIGRAYGLGRKATEPEVRALAEQWVPRRSHAAFAWWWSLSAERGLSVPPP